ncbi:MAG: T9SS type A sorting domain-containing protein [Bacteroidetes bacterium]|nr:T9SS type A sorting domain-containing protein [Bacteroidota bacterium]
MNKHIILLLLAGLAVFPAGLSAQPQRIRIDLPGSAAEEVTIAINPLNPDNIVAGSNLRWFYSSFDGGRTWTQGELGGGTWGDPAVLFDRGGRAYIANLVYGWDAIIVRRSDDGGRSWSEPVKLFGPSSDSARAGSLFRSSLQDKEYLATDLSDGPYGGNIYAAWTDFTLYGSRDPSDSSLIVFARSTNRGESFEPFVRISDRGGNAIDSDETVEGAVPAVGPAGEVYVAWAGPEGLYFDRSFDGGVTFGTDRLISDMPGGWDIHISGISRSNGLPVTVADVSTSPHRGTVYVNWVDQRNGDPDVFILKSTDHGDTWSGPIRVNDDPVGNRRDQFFTWATVDPITGDLWVVFHDRRRYDSDSTDVFLARSTDGGETFVNQRLSDVAFYPSPLVFFGDYNGIAAYDGRVRPIWVELDQGELSIHTALIDLNPSDVDDAALGLEGFRIEAYPNPVAFSAGTSISVELHTDVHGQAEIALYDLMGRRTGVVLAEKIERGSRVLSLDVRGLQPGIYVCRVLLQTGEGTRRTASRLVTILP